MNVLLVFVSGYVQLLDEFGHKVQGRGIGRDDQAVVFGHRP